MHSTSVGDHQTPSSTCKYTTPSRNTPRSTCTEPKSRTRYIYAPSYSANESIEENFLTDWSVRVNVTWMRLGELTPRTGVD